LYAQDASLRSEFLENSPDNFAGRTIIVTGTVERSYGTIGNFVYQLRDDTGQIWIHTNNPNLPSNGSRVTIMGKIVPNLFISEKYWTNGIEEIVDH